jgi:hypothetical protein
MNRLLPLTVVLLFAALPVADAQDSPAPKEQKGEVKSKAQPPAPTVSPHGIPARAGVEGDKSKQSGIRPSQLFQERFDLQVVSGGKGSGMPTSGKKLVIVGIDNHGLLHIRIFDAGGKRVMDTDETKLSDAQVVAVLTLKQQLQGLSAPHVLTGGEKARVIRKVTSIVAQTSRDAQPALRQAQPRKVPVKSRAIRSGSGRAGGSSPNPSRSTEKDAG